MDCTALLEPVGRESFELTLTQEPEYAESVNGGYTTARLICLLPKHRDRILDARARIFPPAGTPWIGRVASVRQNDEVAEVVCTGPQSDLSRFRREAVYCDTRTSEWRQVRESPWLTAISAQTEGANIRFPIPAGSFSGYTASIDYDIPPTTEVTVGFTYTRPVSSCYVQVHVRDGGVWQAVSLSSNTSGAKSVNKTGTAIEKVRIGLWFDAAYNPANDTTSALLANLKIYGIPGITSVTAPVVINDVCNRLPTWVMPAGTEARARISADATVIEPLTFGPGTSELDILEQTAAHRDYDLSFRSKLIAGAYEPVPVYAPRSTTPSYQVFPDFAGTIDLTGDDITAMASAVRVLYSDSNGRTRYVDVVETSEDNRLVTIAQAKTDVITAPTESSATATVIGQKYLALRRSRKVAGTLTLEGAITDMRGAKVLPCQIESGRYIRIHGTPYGTVDARITEVVKTGGHFATLTLDNTPTALDAELALLAKRQQ